MKKLIPLVFVLFALNAQSQSLKDLLFSGKMKTDSGTVVRKGEDLKDKVDTVQKTGPAPVPAPAAEKAKQHRTNGVLAVTAPMAPANAEAVKPAESGLQSAGHRHRDITASGKI
jgi:hypothetical protein